MNLEIDSLFVHFTPTLQFQDVLFVLEFRCSWAPPVGLEVSWFLYVFGRQLLTVYSKISFLYIPSAAETGGSEEKKYEKY